MTRERGGGHQPSLLCSDAIDVGSTVQFWLALAFVM